MMNLENKYSNFLSLRLPSSNFFICFQIRTSCVMHFVAVADAVSLVSRNISRKSCDKENTHLETAHTHTHLSYICITIV